METTPVMETARRVTLPSEAEYPSGWFRFAYSHELSTDKVLNLSFFGRDQVAYREASTGIVRVTDAICPHLGAHLGHGGHVRDDCLVCPFHGWTWSGQGENLAIPGEDGVSRRRLGTWPVFEQNGICYLWHDTAGGEPTWTPGPFLLDDESDYFPLDPTNVLVWPDVNVYPQSIVENVADAGHFKFIHGSGEIPDVKGYEVTDSAFYSHFEYEWGAGLKSTWLTPDGPINSNVYTESWGLGIVVTRYTGIPECVQVTGTTPIAGRRSAMGTAILMKRSPESPDEMTTVQRKLVDHLLEQPRADLPIWEHMAMLEQPAYRKGEARIYAAVRAWASHFYPSHQANVA